MIVLRGKLVENRPIDVVRDAWRTITRAAYRAVGLYWVEKFLPKHFEPGAASRYRYDYRSAAYLMRKHGTNIGSMRISGIERKDQGSHLRKLDDETPLVLTGRMKQDVLSQSVVRGFPTRATIYLYGPSYMNVKLGAGYTKRKNNKGGTFVDYTRHQPDKAKEMTTVTPPEREELAKVLRQELLAGIAAYRGTKTTE